VPYWQVHVQGCGEQVQVQGGGGGGGMLVNTQSANSEHCVIAMHLSSSASTAVRELPPSGGIIPLIAAFLHSPTVVDPILSRLLQLSSLRQISET
jgi:hypothetical protein